MKNMGKRCPVCGSTDIVDDYSKSSGKSCLTCNSEIKKENAQFDRFDDIDLENIYTKSYELLFVAFDLDGWLRNRTHINIV